MKDLFVFATSSTFCTLPLVKQIYNFLQKKYNTFVIESKIETFEDFFQNPNFDSKIYNYKTYNAYANQTIFEKIFKHIKLLFYFIKVRFVLTRRYERVYLYSFELYLISLAIILKTKNLYIIYHQYEMVIPNEINTLDKFYLNYIINRWDKVDLAIFPELNRIEYFKNMLPNFRDSQFFLMPNSNNNLIAKREENRKNIKIRVIHIGALGSNHHIKSLIETINILPEDKFEFYFVGNIVEDVRNQIRKIEKSNVFTLSQVKHSELHDIYLNCDIGLILYQNDTLNTYYCAPNKLYEFWSYGIPVIGDKLPGLISVFNDQSLGTLVNMNDPMEIKNAIINLSKLNKSTKLQLERIFEDQFKLDKYLNRFENIIKGN